MELNDHVLCNVIINSQNDITACLELAVQYCNRAAQIQSSSDFLRSIELFDFAIALLKYSHAYGSRSFADALIGRAIAVYWYAKVFPTRSNLINLCRAEQLLCDAICLLSNAGLVVNLVDETTLVDITRCNQQIGELQRSRIALALQAIGSIRQLRSGQPCAELPLQPLEVEDPAVERSAEMWAH